MKSQIQISLAVGAVAILAVAGVLARGSLVTGVVLAALGLAALGGFGTWSLRRGRHTPWESARTLVRPGAAVVLWKPGCPYCERLLRALGDDDRITWVNVWQDEAAQRRVCELNDGNEYVPTALVADRVLRNPSAVELVEALR